MKQSESHTIIPSSENQTHSASAHAETAMQLLKQGMQLQAELHLAQAVTLEPTNAQWQLELARLQRLYDHDLARQTYAIAESLGSTNAVLEGRALSDEADAIEYLRPEEIWQVDRLDISVKLLFARNFVDPANRQTDLAHGLYRRHILQRTKGQEPESLSKTSLQDYEHSFESLIASIRANGFPDAFAIPIDCNGRILNGAHRLAAALALQLDRVPVVRMPSSWHAFDWGMAWFLRHDFIPEEINLMLRLWIEAHPDQIGLFAIEHWGSGIPEDLMTELRQQFPLLAWRDMHPTIAMHPLPPDGITLGPWRYVLVDKQAEAAFQSFAAMQNEKYANRLHCRALSGEKSHAWTATLLNEAIVASWHPKKPTLTKNSSSVACWMRYGDKTNPILP